MQDDRQDHGADSAKPTDSPMTHPLAALIAGMPRYSLTQLGPVEGGQWLNIVDILAGLEAATPPDLVEAAGKVADRLSVFRTTWGELPSIAPHIATAPGITTGTVIGACDEAINTIRALIALATAQAAQIAGHEAKVVELSRERFLADHALVDKYRRGGTGIFKFPDDVSAIIRKLDAAEATAATLRAEVERLRGALDRIDQWADAYPLEVFAEPDFAKADEVLKTAGLSLSAISASNMRHVIEGVKAITSTELEGKHE